MPSSMRDVVRPAVQALRRRLFLRFGASSWMGQIPGLRPVINIAGACPVCECDTRFCAWNAWLRESLYCLRCNSLPRERALVAVLSEVRPAWRTLRIHESSPASLTNKLARECQHYLPTHFHPDTPPGMMIPRLGVRCENLERQTFPDESFDIVVTQDVLEHVFEPERAFEEIARTLVPDGLHIATVPLVRGDGPSARRAHRTRDGRVEHLVTPEYHGNPIDSEGSLVTFDWGRDIAARMDRQGFFSTQIYEPHDARLGILGSLTEVIVSTRVRRSS